MHETRFVPLDKIARGEMFGEPPDEIHLHVDRRQGEARLEDQEHAAVKEKACAEKCDRDGNPTVAHARDGDDAESDARRDEDAERHVKGGHRALQDARAARQPVELLEDDLAPFVQEFQISLAVR